MIRGILILFIMTFISISTVYGESEGILNRLLAPGPLIGGHKDLEKTECLKCHESGKGIPESKCLDCHKEIRKFVESKKGFHGMVGKTCIECHADHKGRDFDSTLVDQKKFEHAKMTGYELEGKHAELKCQECHKEKRNNKFLRRGDIRYIGKTSTCVGCHKEDDPHFFKGNFAKKDCAECHSQKGWDIDTKFDHGKDTKFKLEGQHAELECNDCHLQDKKKMIFQYKWSHLEQKQCLSCHKDQHKNNLSPKFQNGNCTVCHAQNSWKIEKFNHFAATKYDLKFKHAETKCVDCHKQDSKAGKIAKGAKITKPTFEKPLKDFNFTGLKTACLSCHEDFHKFGPGYKSTKYGDINQCAKCHNESKWKNIHNFDHNENTRYPIDGKHTELKCEECHLPKDPKNNTKLVNKNIGVFHWEKLDTKTCENCHKNPHIGEFKGDALKKKCSECHITESWTAMKSGNNFDHSKTRFALTGAHEKTKCSICHNIEGKKVFKYKSFEQKFCIDCHQNIHKGQFVDKLSSKSCAECHTTKNFTERLKFDHNQTNYKLNGAHAELKCQDCHTQTKDNYVLKTPNISQKDFAAKRVSVKSLFVFTELKTKVCLSCHQDYHKGQLSNDCLKCHTETSWKKPQFDHDKQSTFPLVEKHKDAACSKCHKAVPNEFTFIKKDRKPLIQYKPLAKMCIDCHKDVHKGNFGKQCQECHIPRGWKVTKDFHKNFTLTGIHYTLECAECHKNGRKLAGLSQQCISCHQKDDVHSGSLPNCKECHRQQFWEVSGFKHSMTRFPLRGAHRTLDCLECHYKGGAQAIYQGLTKQCQSCHATDFTSASSAAATAGHSGQSSASDCSTCHRNQFSFKSAN